MALISLNDVSLGFGGPPLLDHVSLHLQEGDHLCLLGRNGAGKSSLLRLIAGEHTADTGLVSINRDTRVTLLEQDSETDFQGTALEYCRARGAPGVASERYLTQLGMAASATFAHLSGGGQRRVMLAATLATGADILLLDEPTNHLDIESVLWLEEHLRKQVKTFIIVTHDRAIARSVSNRVADLDRGELFTFACGFEEFLRRRDHQLTTEETERALADKQLAKEEAWLRRGVKARRTRDEGRVRALLKLREEYRERRSRPGQINLRVQDAGRSGNLVVETTDLTFDYPEESPAPPVAGRVAPVAGRVAPGTGKVAPRTSKVAPGTSKTGPASPIISTLTTTILRGDKVGIVGPNGVGKTTLIRLLLGELEPIAGTVRRGVNLQPIYFDQIRGTLDPTRSVIENLSDGDDMVVIGGKAKHVKAYLQDFLFDEDRIRSPVGVLSGGEKNRLLLAKLFLQPSNLLVMDEPTNDLDLDTLELLEEMLLSYKGTLLLVSHDRDLLDNVVTDCLVFTRAGMVEELAGGYSDWGERVAQSAQGGGASPRAADGARKGKREQGERSRDRKLSFKETRELESLPETITTLETRIAELHETLADPDLYRDEGGRVGALTGELAEKESQLSIAYERWEELEQIQSAQVT